MLTPSARGAEYGFGELMELAHAEPVAVAEHGRPIVVVVSAKEFDEPRTFGEQAQLPIKKGNI